MCDLCLAAFREYFPDGDDELMEFVLWEKTAFPAGSPEQITRQIKEYAQELNETATD